MVFWIQIRKQIMLINILNSVFQKVSVIRVHSNSSGGTEVHENLQLPAPTSCLSPKLMAVHAAEAYRMKKPVLVPSKS
jgi:hypothetical protein